MSTQSINVTNEQNAPLASVVVEAVDPTTGRIAATATTDHNGIAVFKNIDANANLNYNARVTRRGGIGSVNVSRGLKQDDAASPAFNSGDPKSMKAINADINIIFTTAPKQVAAAVPTTDITIQRVDKNGLAYASGALTVYLYSSSATGVFSTGTTVTIPDGSDTASFTYTDTVGGNPVLTASTVALT